MNVLATFVDGVTDHRRGPDIRLADNQLSGGDSLPGIHVAFTPVADLWQTCHGIHSICLREYRYFITSQW